VVKRIVWTIVALVALLAAYLVLWPVPIRAVGWQAPASPGYFDLLTNWDGQWYQDVAQNGYPAHLPRAGDPSEIGPVIAFVGSRINSYMTGANINVDGGSDFT